MDGTRALTGHGKADGRPQRGCLQGHGVRPQPASIPCPARTQIPYSRRWDQAKPPPPAPGTENFISPQLFLPNRITCRARFKQNKISCHGYPEQGCYI